MPACSPFLLDPQALVPSMRVACQITYAADQAVFSNRLRRQHDHCKPYLLDVCLVQEFIRRKQGGFEFQALLVNGDSMPILFAAGLAMLR